MHDSPICTVRQRSGVLAAADDWRGLFLLCNSFTRGRRALNTRSVGHPRLRANSFEDGEAYDRLRDVYSLDGPANYAHGHHPLRSPALSARVAFLANACSAHLLQVLHGLVI